ncbi:hypothetical protein Tco_0108774 [Tanacetum coccineum]
MADLKFADNHNLVAFLSKPAESEGFEQIVDFLNANPIRYALTINPTIYIWCIKQFWSTVKAKTVNGEVQLHALVDGKKIIITESTVRRDIQLEYAEGVDCLPNSIIFEQLTLMGSKTTAWNEFSSIMAYAIMCLATNQKFNFSKYIFESMVKNLDNVGKILMYPRRRIGKGFSRRETPLFQAEMGEGSVNPTDPHHTPTFIQPLTSQPQKKQKSRKPKRKDTHIPQSSGPTEHVANEAVFKELDDSLATPNESSSLGTTSGGSPRRQETIGETIAQTRFENVSKHSNDPLLTREYSRDEESLGKDASKPGRVNAIDADEDITLVNDQDDADMFDANTLTDDEVLVEQEVATKDPSVPVIVASTKDSAATTTTTATTPRKGIVITELEAIRLQAEFDEDERLAREKDEANVALTEEWDDIQAKVDVDYQLAQRLQAKEQEQFTTEQKATLFKELLEQRRKHFAAKRAEEKRNKPPTKTQQKKTMITYLKNMEETVEVDDDQEATKIKELIKIIPNEEEVAIDAIPLATNPPTIVDWNIHKDNQASNEKH